MLSLQCYISPHPVSFSFSMFLFVSEEDKAILICAPIFHSLFILFLLLSNLFSSHYTTVSFHFPFFNEDMEAMVIILFHCFHLFVLLAVLYFPAPRIFPPTPSSLPSLFLKLSYTSLLPFLSLLLTYCFFFLSLLIFSSLPPTSSLLIPSLPPFYSAILRS